MYMYTPVCHGHTNDMAYTSFFKLGLNSWQNQQLSMEDLSKEWVSGAYLSMIKSSVHLKLYTKCIWAVIAQLKSNITWTNKGFNIIF